MSGKLNQLLFLVNYNVRQDLDNLLFRLQHIFIDKMIYLYGTNC